MEDSQEDYIKEFFLHQAESIKRDIQLILGDQIEDIKLSSMDIVERLDKTDEKIKNINGEFAGFNRSQGIMDQRLQHVEANFQKEQEYINEEIQEISRTCKDLKGRESDWEVFLQVSSTLQLLENRVRSVEARYLSSERKLNSIRDYLKTINIGSGANADCIGIRDSNTAQYSAEEESYQSVAKSVEATSRSVEPPRDRTWAGEDSLVDIDDGATSNDYLCTDFARSVMPFKSSDVVHITTIQCLADEIRLATEENIMDGIGGNPAPFGQFNDVESDFSSYASHTATSEAREVEVATDMQMRGHSSGANARSNSDSNTSGDLTRHPFSTASSKYSEESHMDETDNAYYVAVTRARSNRRDSPIDTLQVPYLYLMGDDRPLRHARYTLFLREQVLKRTALICQNRLIQTRRWGLQFRKFIGFSLVALLLSVVIAEYGPDIVVTYSRYDDCNGRMLPKSIRYHIQ